MMFPFRKGKKMTDVNPVNESENPETTTESTPETPPTYEELQARVAELEGMVHEEQLRGLANEQNLRRRFAEELQNAHKFAAQKFAAEMLIIKDYLEMALLDQSGNFEALKMGVNMTLTEVQKAFETTGIKEIAAQVGEKTNPHLHQEMQAVESEQEAGTIVSVLKKGYTLNERVLRPVMVTVAKTAETSEDE